ncbi:MAG: hypothetical protein WDO73_04420 [Ignavibacteriota bacterium]
MSNQDNSDEVRSLLARLNEWQRMSGMRPEGKPGFKSLGESDAAIENLKEQLDALGVTYRWSDRDRKWEVIPKESDK